MKIYNPITIITLIAVLFGCEHENPCANAYPTPPTIRFTLVDSITGRSLVGYDRLYHPDTINKLNHINTLQAYGSYDSTIIYHYGRSFSGRLQILRLNESESDTLKVDYIELDNECFTTKEVTTFFYNRKLIDTESRLYIIRR